MNGEGSQGVGGRPCRSLPCVPRTHALTDGALEGERDAEEGQADDGEEAVPEDGADAPDVDLLDREEVEHQVHGQAARDAEAVDVPEVHLCVPGWVVCFRGGGCRMDVEVFELMGLLTTVPCR